MSDFIPTNKLEPEPHLMNPWAAKFDLAVPVPSSPPPVCGVRRKQAAVTPRRRLEVRWHLRHVYHKLHVRSRTEAALKFLSGKAE